MSPNKDFDSSKPDYFLPHHAVQKKDSITTKLRAVFDGSYSQVVLSWLSSPPRNWKPFVANRTSEILDLIPQNRWRFRSNMSKQKLGDLPEGRVTLNRPFFVCGIDYAGPISILKHRGRGAKTTKGYMVVFVCLATKALHLELVTDYTSDSFIAALKRFCSRRSTPKHIHSDNGTNFLGAKRKFKDLYNHLSKINLDQKVSYFLSQQEIEWHTIPPLSPHFGGLWEAGVKSVKFHLKRVLGNSNLTFEELYTLLTQIETILNSRPLVSVDNDAVDNLNVLTPSHFIIGDVINSPPETLEVSTLSLRKRWDIVQKMK
ncbi:uncharacterized protein LOC129959385 [Argiope bruennichi]|uniref:uncharacterized protein LOC129959385 n=1 Tax=Argiope bruennichi TaxID=94029 RepID=UPI0024956B6B|nr:uncharacterized protein LOC129959385 [Argiope bruennichi]